jgi:ATP-dependent Clp protease protease subunit
MRKAIQMLDEVKESINQRHTRFAPVSAVPSSATLWTAKTWMNANKAINLGFADELLFTDTKENLAPPADANHRGGRVRLQLSDCVQ